MIVRDADRPDVEHVCRHMRAESAIEAFASLEHEDRGALAAQLAYVIEHGHATLKALAIEGALAAALVGVVAVAPGRGSIMFLATDAFPAIALPVHRWWWREFVPEVLSQFRRVEFTGSLPATESGRWLAAIGFRCEGIARAYHKSGADLAHWAWVNPRGRTVDAAAVAVGSAA